MQDATGLLETWTPVDPTFSKMLVRLQSTLGTMKNAETMLGKIGKTPLDECEVFRMLPFSVHVKAISKCGRDVFAETLTSINWPRGVDELQSH